MKPVISYSLMKYVKDCIAGQPNQTAINNLIKVLGMPGVTHFEVAIPINSSAAFEKNGTNPSLLTVEAFTDMVLDCIHNAGYNAMIRGTDCNMEQIFNFSAVSQPPSYWINEATAWLSLHKAHLKNGDEANFFPEADGHINYNGASPIDNGQHNWRADYNQFWQELPVAINQWSTQNGIAITCHTTVNGTSISNATYNGSTFNTQGSDQIVNPQSVAALGGMYIDWYNYANVPTDEADYIAWYKASLAFFQTIHPGATINVQEWGDTRPASVVASDPILTANMCDQIFFPMLKAGSMTELNLWCGWDTAQEGILTADGDNIAWLNAGNMPTLNAKGQALTSIFKKWYGTVTPTPPTPPDPTVPEAFTYTGPITF